MNARALPSLWSIVLAGGAGRRLLDVTGGVPKQFWQPQGRSSLLDQTLARVAALSAPSRTLVVIRAEHAMLADAAGVAQRAHVVVQPADRGTGFAVLAGLAAMPGHGADQIVVVTPSDHGMRDTSRFRSDLLRAASAIASGRTSMVVIGAAAFEPASDYGWLTLASRPGGRGADGLRDVVGFVEKPPPADAVRLLAAGAVWNTLVFVARADALLAMYDRSLPELARAARECLAAPPPSRVDRLCELYGRFGAVDFSRDLLTAARGVTALTWPASMGWTDLGTPARLSRWLQRADDGAARRALAAS
jgi:mannose-1-phosphate guanylyltransferase